MSQSAKVFNLGLLLVILMIGGSAFVHYQMKLIAVARELALAAAVQTPTVPAAQVAAQPAPSGGLGSVIYQNASNPVNNKIPDTGAAVPNPIVGAYTNPFE